MTDRQRDDAASPVCALCGRAAPLTRHHLIPRSQHGRRRFRRRFSRETMRTAVLWLCRPCHSHVHRVFGERELADSYNTYEALLSAPEIHRFAEWLADKPAGFKPRSPPRRPR
ncbi:hypothetical protein C7446_1752 [Kushneria sinocarnis]|uniref:HNH endonuclease n=1 Tax=Kushneria sinocarnis TaxID=595502 RepID=A0A420WXY6_9GAMM|nr:hypothetical protein [Kushneria sinocarnis]RKR04542.1 hypothetical protein C7446_1752 [Kushneria sinocarnis]